MTQVKIISDSNAESPREWDNLGTMVCVHGRYNLGDKKAISKLQDQIRSHKNYRDSMEEEYDFSKALDLYNLAQKIGLFGAVLPLYLYDHSGITMNTTGFSCSWDSGQVGFIYVTKEEMRSEYSVQRVTKKLIERIEGYLKGEVETYDQYLRNDIFGFVIEDDEGEEIDSCWGFYGSDVTKNGMLEHIDEKYHELAKEAEPSYS